jgi:hypothetical protein
MPVTRVSSGVTAFLIAGESTVPVEVWKTTVSRSPLCAGNSFVSRSMARWASVPGSEKFVA